MARIDFLLQAVTHRFHADELRKMLAGADCKGLLVSIAFARLDGVEALAATLKPIAKAAVFFVGIRNGVTSVQALKRLLEIGLRLFVVDTGSRTRIFHPKLFLAERESSAALIVEGIDQRRCFREEIFGDLGWETDPRRPHEEQCSASSLAPC